MHIGESFRRSLLRSAAVAFILASIAPAPEAHAASCSGNACNQITLDLNHCQVRNTGDKPARVELNIELASLYKFNSQSEIDIPAIGAGSSVRIQGFGGCPDASDLASYNAYLAVSDPANWAKLDAAFGSNMQLPQCSGTACNVVALDEENNCVWATNKSAKPVAMTAAFGATTISVALDGADAKKAGPRSDIIGSPMDTGIDPRCGEAERSEKMLEQLKAQGNSVPDDPSLDQLVWRCQQQQKAAAAKSTAPAASRENGYQAWGYEAFTNSHYPIYWGRLVTPSGCVQRISDLRSYTANYQ